jgi:hypothetical protein
VRISCVIISELIGAISANLRVGLIQKIDCVIVIIEMLRYKNMLVDRKNELNT